MDEIVKEFLIESKENLDQLDQALVKLEADPASKELLAAIFRTIHTIKGTCSFLGFPRLEKVAHAGESLLSRLRDGQLVLSEEIVSGLLAMVDAVRQMLAVIEASEKDGEEEYAQLIERLAWLSSGATGDETSDNAKPNSEADQASPGEKTADPAPALFSETLAESSKLGGLLLERGQVRPEDLARALQQQELGRKRIGEILIAQGAVSPEHVLAAQQILESRNPDAGVDTVRVGVNLLDRLMNLVGELVLVRNQMLQLGGGQPESALQTVSQRLNLVTTELQQEVTKTRMQPIGNLWNKFPRTVRDLALACGKEVVLVLEGQETELDRTILEAIRDPLTHLLRNCIDHGIEQREVRKQAGKNAAGTVKLRAFHAGGQVNIEISDDGAGLNWERIRDKGIECGLLSAASAPLSEADLCRMIFMPGFSTAERVTAVSGRGVGLDVVKTNIERIAGLIDLQSSTGKGTTIKIKIPLTLTIIPALMVSCGGQRFAIPQASLLELVRLETGETARAVEFVRGVPVYRLRGRLLPLVYLNRALQLASDGTESQPADSATNIVVVRADGQDFGLVVDEIADTEEIVVKPMGKQLQDILVYSGATIMGDGRVALILDILGLAQHSHIVGAAGEANRLGKTQVLVDTPPRAENGHQSVLIAQCGRRGHRLAIPLPMVVRLEEFPAASVEMLGTTPVVQHDGRIIPLILLSGADASGLAEIASAGAVARLPVVICSETGWTVGLVVDRIVDVVNESLVLQHPVRLGGALGACLVQDRVTELLNVVDLVRESLPGIAKCPTRVV